MRLAQRLTKLETRLTEAGWNKEELARYVAATFERLSKGERREIPPEMMQRLDKLAERFFPKPAP